MANSPKVEDMKLRSKTQKLSKPDEQFKFKPKKISVKGLRSKPKTSKKAKTGKGMLGKAMGKLAKSYKK